MSNNPSRFNPYGEDDPDRVDPNARTRRVERAGRQTQPLDPNDAGEQPAGGDRSDWRTMVQGQTWRKERHARGGRTLGGRPSMTMPNTEGFFRWATQEDGWKFLAGGAAIFIVLMLVLLWPGASDEPAAQPMPTRAPAAGGGLPVQPTGSIVTPTPPGEPAGLPIPTTGAPANPPASPPALVVTGTGVEGLFLRDAPGGTIVTTLPEGTRVEVIGPDQSVGGLVWRHIREPGGAEGFSATDYLQPAP